MDKIKNPSNIDIVFDWNSLVIHDSRHMKQQFSFLLRIKTSCKHKIIILTAQFQVTIAGEVKFDRLCNNWREFPLNSRRKLHYKLKKE
jgi:hypothetical protein